MNFLSGVKSKSVLGRKLSNRYLSRDAFTSTNRFGRKGIRRLGTAFKTRRSLFELKFTVMKVLLLVFVLLLVVYTIPTFRFMIHGNLVEYMLTDEQRAIYAEAREGEFFVAPKYLSTDVFRVDDAGYENTEGSLVYDALQDHPVGVYTKDADVSYVRLFSDPDFKNNFFIKIKNVVKKEVTMTSTSTPASSSVVSSTDTGGESPNVVNISYNGVLFTGSGYGELVAKLPPQEGNIHEGDMIYVQTTKGLKPTAVVYRISDENSSGSTFTFVYAQLLSSPQKLYKVKISNQ